MIFCSKSYQFHTLSERSPHFLKYLVSSLKTITRTTFAHHIPTTVLSIIYCQHYCSDSWFSSDSVQQMERKLCLKRYCKKPSKAMSLSYKFPTASIIFSTMCGVTHLVFLSTCLLAFELKTSNPFHELHSLQYWIFQNLYFGQIYSSNCSRRFSVPPYRKTIVTNLLSVFTVTIELNSKSEQNHERSFLQS